MKKSIWKKRLVSTIIAMSVLTCFAPCINGEIEKQDNSFVLNNCDNIKNIKSYGNPPEEIWNQTFGDIYNNYGYSSYLANDGGIVITGCTEYNSPPKWTDALLIKSDSEGNETWYKEFGGNFFDKGYSVQQTDDEGYIFAGVTSYFIWLVKTDENGNLTWSRSINGSFTGVGTSVRQTSDGGYIITGYEERLLPDEYFNCLLIKTDIYGNETWRNVFGGIVLDDQGYCVQETTDGGFIIAGATRTFCDDSQDAWLIKTDSEGKEQWNKSYEGPREGDIVDEFRWVLQTNDSGYIATGFTTSPTSDSVDVWYVKTDENGNETWNKTFGGDNNDASFCIQGTNDGGFIITGITESFSAGDYDVLLIKTNESGNISWFQSFGGVGMDGGLSVQQANDSSFFITGYTASYGAGGLDIWLIKAGLKKEPDLNCGGSLSWTGVNPGATVTGFFTVENTGEPDSLLDWEINETPDWGIWTFTPSSGDDLLPNNPVTVGVTVIAPNQQNEEFTGNVTIVNKENISDFCTIDVSLATPVSQPSPQSQYFNIHSFIKRLML